MSPFARRLVAAAAALVVAVVTLRRRHLVRFVLRLHEARRHVHEAEVPQPRHEPEPPAELLVIRDQLSAADAHSRLSGLRAWVDYGQADRANRQPAIDVLCDSLRALPWPGNEQDQRWRMVLQASLAAHLRPGPGFWLDTDVDLSHTILVDFDLSECRMRTVSFSCTRFIGDARFDETTFIGDVEFNAALFGRHAVFAESVFAKRATFSGAAFCGNGNFSGVHIAGNANFARARFSGRADFSDVRFGGDADYREVRFSGRALFRRTGFAGASRFDEAWFRGREDFVGAAFGGESGFDGTRFGHRIHVE